MGRGMIFFTLGVLYCTVLKTQSYCSTSTYIPVSTDIAISRSGFLLTTGSTAAFGSGSDDVAVQKFDASGSLIWSNAYGGSSADNGYNIEEALNGDYFVAGRTSSFPSPGSDCYILRLDTSGVVKWSAVVGGPGNDEALGLASTSDNGCIVCGVAPPYSNSLTDIYIVKLDSNGLLNWTTRIGTPNTDIGMAITEDPQGNFIVAGNSQVSNGGRHLVVAKLDAMGNVIWKSEYIANSQQDWIYPVSIIVLNNQYYVGGYMDTLTSSIQGQFGFLMKLDTSGVFQNCTLLNTSAQLKVTDMKITASNYFIYSGTTTVAANPGRSGVVFSTDTSGVPVWFLETSMPGNTECNGIAESINGTICTAGFTVNPSSMSCSFISQITNNVMCCGHTKECTVTQLDFTRWSFGNILGGGTIGTGVFVASGGSYSVVCSSADGIDDVAEDDAISIYPNPASTEINVVSETPIDSVRIVNILGQEILSNAVRSSSYTIDVGNFESGTYVIYIYRSTGSIIKPCIIQ